MTSNFNDSGYTLPGGLNLFNQYNVNVSGTTIAPQDIYKTVPQVGVYMLNGGRKAYSTIFPVFMSTSNLMTIGVPLDSDDAWVVYPGYGFQLYTDYSYGGYVSNQYINISNVPTLFYLSGGGWDDFGTVINEYGTTTAYPVHNTISVKIFFRGQQIPDGGW